MKMTTGWGEVSTGVAVGVAPLMLALLLVGGAAGLRCLQCENCSHGGGSHASAAASSSNPAGGLDQSLQLGVPVACRAGQTVCMKILWRGRVQRSCGTRDVCGYGVKGSERWSRRLWRQITNLVSRPDLEADVEDEKEKGYGPVWCCSTDFCNVSSKTHLSTVTLMTTTTIPVLRRLLM